MGVAIRVWCVLVLTACGDAKSSSEVEAPPPPATKVEEVLASIVATCAKCDGTEVRRKGKPYWETIAMGGTFRDGDWIRTGASGTARIRFVSGGHLDLDEKTTLFVESDTAKRAVDGKATGVHVAMQSGGASGVLEGKDAPIALRTSDGVVRIGGGQGTSEFRLKPTTDGAVEVAATKGDLVVRNGADERRIEPPKTDPVKPKPVAPKYVPQPKPKKDAIAFPSSTTPRIDAHFKCMALLEIPLRWNPVGGATNYKVIVARDMSFRSVVVAKELKDTGFTFRPPGPGTYVWRVAARDGRGYGEFGFARRIFCD